MLRVAIVATVAAFIQNLLLFAFGLKEMAIVSSPFSFVGIFLLEVTLIWAAYFGVHQIVRRRRELVLVGCASLILGTAELVLPVSYFTSFVRHARRARVLNRIEYSGTSIKPLTSDSGSFRFALTYTLRFPRTGHYLTFPAYLGPPGNRVFGNYFTKIHPEYYDEEYIFDAGKPNGFTVVFDTQGKRFDLAKDKANIDLCDGKDYFMICRIIPVDLSGDRPGSGRQARALSACGQYR